MKILFHYSDLTTDILFINEVYQKYIERGYNQEYFNLFISLCVVLMFDRFM